MTVRIDVPATLSNLGPGFDVLGLALDWTNTFFFEPAERWLADGSPIAPDDHLCLATARTAGEVFGRPLTGLQVRQEERIPRARGLGSSATARVAGLLAWIELSGVRPAPEELLAFLAKAEGHPDNVAPALLGGLILCADPLGRQHLRLPAPDLQVALCVPEVEVSTDAARAILPDAIPREDAIFNVSRASLLVAGLATGDHQAVAAGLEDRLHQPWRKQLIGPVDEAFAAARAAGALGAFISGSGSTLAAFVAPDADAMAVAGALADPFVRKGIPCDSRAARPSEGGAAPWASTSRWATS